MNRIEPSGSRPSGPEGLSGHPRAYQDVHELTGLRAKLAAQSDRPHSPSLPALFRDAFARSADSSILPEPVVPVSLGQRPRAAELRKMARRLLDKHGRTHEGEATRASAESEMLATLEQMLRAQDRLQARIAELQKS